MVPCPAQYLLRFDDLCPTISQRQWQRFLPLIKEFGIRPILAVIPDNQDYNLQLSPPDPEFWVSMRTMEEAGATIALHGYQHLCKSRGPSHMDMHRYSEFAGVPEDTQREWIRRGLKILRDHGLSPKLWVAPRHGFDGNTLRALQKEGINALSDGFARVPVSRGGIVWIPQQLWAPVDKSKGIWTICLHPNSVHDSMVEKLRAFLRRHSAQFTSVERVLAELDAGELTMTERLYESMALWRRHASNFKRRFRSRHRKH